MLVTDDGFDSEDLGKGLVLAIDRKDTSGCLNILYEAQEFEDDSFFKEVIQFVEAEDCLCHLLKLLSGDEPIDVKLITAIVNEVTYINPDILNLVMDYKMFDVAHKLIDFGFKSSYALCMAILHSQELLIYKLMIKRVAIDRFTLLSTVVADNIELAKYFLFTDFESYSRKEEYYKDNRLYKEYHTYRHGYVHSYKFSGGFGGLAALLLNRLQFIRLFNKLGLMEDVVSIFAFEIDVNFIANACDVWETLGDDDVETEKSILYERLLNSQVITDMEMKSSIISDAIEDNNPPLLSRLLEDTGYNISINGRPLIMYLLEKYLDAMEDDDGRIEMLHDAIIKTVGETDYINGVVGEDAPLFAAIRCNLCSVVDILIQRGADVKQLLWGQCPLAIAIEEENEAISELLIRNHAAIDIQDEEGKTPLICAVKHYLLNTVRLLITHNSDVSIKDNYGKTAYDYAKQCPNAEDIVAILDSPYTATCNETTKKPSI